MAYQWDRFIYWLAQGQNAGAVQALAALCTVVLTVILLIITAVYAYFTWHLLRTSRQGLETTAEPQFTVSLTTEVLDENSEEVVTTIQNVGNMSFTVRLVMVHIECAYARRAGYVSNQYMAGTALERILAPQEKMSTLYQTYRGRSIYHHGSSHPHDPCKPVYSAVINVEDLHGNLGWFRYDPHAGLRRDPRLDRKAQTQERT